MTKRAGKRKHRNGNQRHPPGPIQSPPAEAEQELLPPKEAAKLETRALREGWLLRVGNPEATQQIREKLMQRVATIAATSNDPKITIAAFRAIVAAETRERYGFGNPGAGDLPKQMQPQQDVPRPVSQIEILQAIQNDPLIIDALDYRPVKHDDYAEFSGTDQS